MRLNSRSLFVLAGILLWLTTACGGGSEPATTPDAAFILAEREVLGEAGEDAVLLREIARFDAGSFVRDPAVSPDGSRIAFSLQPPARTRPEGGIDFGGDLYVVDRDGSNLTLVARHASIAEYLESPAWLDENTLVFGVRGVDANDVATFRVETIDLGSDQRRVLVEGALSPSVSPDRRQLAYVRVRDDGTEVLEVAPVGGGAARVLAGPEANVRLISSVVFSPDGTRVAFAAVDAIEGLPGAPGRSLRSLAPSRSNLLHPFAQDIWVVDVTGADLHRVSDLAENMPSVVWGDDGAALTVLGPTALWRIDLGSNVTSRLNSGRPFTQIVAAPAG